MRRFEILDAGMGIKLIRRLPLRDGRGSLTRLFSSGELAEAGWARPVVQVNWVENIAAGTTRGLHYQAAPHLETKLLCCMAGRIADVLVDVQRGSPTFLKSVVVELDAAANAGLLIPAGFAHGYQCLTAGVQLLYFHDAAHEPGSERGLNVLDPMLNISWPLPVTNLSSRDSAHAMIDAGFSGELI